MIAYPAVVRWVVMIGAVAGCGRVAFEPVTDGALAAVDAPVDETRCTWSAPVAIAELNTPASEAEPALSPDGAVLVFTSDRLGDDDLFVSVRQDDGWTAPSVVASLQSGADDQGPAWSADGTQLYFTSYRSGPLRVYASSYDGGTFGPPVLVPGLESLTEVTSPTVRRDDREMFYSSRVPPSAIERATRASPTDAWTPRGPVPELVASRDRGYPGLSPTGHVLYFEQTEPGVGFHIARVARSTLDEPFGAPERVTEIAGGRNDGDPEVSADGTQLLLSSDRARAGDYDLYLATRTCP